LEQSKSEHSSILFIVTIYSVTSLVAAMDRNGHKVIPMTKTAKKKKSLIDQVPRAIVIPPERRSTIILFSRLTLSKR
jgi:hypothetical protein